MFLFLKVLSGEGMLSALSMHCISTFLIVKARILSVLVLSVREGCGVLLFVLYSLNACFFDPACCSLRRGARSHCE